ncbi:MAG: stage II sporulation protein M [Bacteroidota bacterium]
MREGMFIKRNVDKWNQYQHDKTSDPDETAERFVTLVDDLSYAKTFYPQSKATRWINSIAANIYQSIYKNRKDKYARFFAFWKYDLPFLFKRHHKVLLFTFLLFSSFVFIGVFSSIKDPTFVRGILGNNYVDMTEENINNNDPFGVYKDNNPFTMFVRIAVHNTSLAFLMAIGGILLGVVTLYFMWTNGLMLGTFQYMFFEKGLGLKSMMVIWTHGTLEILALIISSTAGFIIAGSILFPGTYSRMESFKQGIKDALKIMIVLVPIFITASFLETYVTHLMGNKFDSDGTSYGPPDWVFIFIFGMSFLFILWYFVLYPIVLHKRNPGKFIKKNNPSKAA